MKISPRVVVGLLIVAFGLALTLDELGVMNAGELIHYWPFGVVAVGIANLLDQDRSKRTLGWILTGVGAVLVLQNFLNFDIDIWRFWPLAIVVFGLLIVYRSMRPRPEGADGPGYTIGGGTSTSNAAPNKAGSLEQVISEFVMWSGIQRRVASPAFKRADLTAIMGGVELDLRQASTENGHAVIDVFVLWGGIEIIVPPDWAVSNEITPIMGGAEDGSTGTQQAKHRLVVTGVVIMGGVDIKV
jgi:predicted membrane protein